MAAIKTGPNEQRINREEILLVENQAPNVAESAMEKN